MGDDELGRQLLACGYTPDGPGAAVAVRGADERVTTASTGHAAPGIPFHPDTTSYAGSVAKQVVGACAALVVVSGELSPEAPIGRLLPELPPWAARVRVRHLLHHTAGLPGDRQLNALIAERGRPRWDGPAVLTALADCPELEFQPGTQYRYRNAGYIVLAAVLARLANMPFPELADRLLFGPLGMHRSRFADRPEAVPRDAATGHPAEDTQVRWPLPLSLGDGGLWTCVADLHRWNDALLPGGALDQRAAALMHTPGRLDDGQPIDYAWGVRVSTDFGTLTHSHGGVWPGGWTAKLIRLPELGIGIAAMSNSGDVPRMIELSDRVAHSLTD
ncbi:MAG TPA: serine hydrolase domain-containing protein [Pseudonocardiaceae bacterium]|jgi:CubicO group peptidase (beta-lactamase class C family)|nr:serine hydrolase domain-containing protein [Pseudonocardiaceae bacterium]